MESLKMSGNHFAAFDLGAESGRAIVGTFENDKITLRELHRFANKQLSVKGHIHWDVDYLFNEIKNGLARIAKAGYKLNGIGVDTWGVDFGLLDSRGNLIENPFAYRDARTMGIAEKVFAIMPKREIYERTGIQFLEFNTLFQLYSMVGSESLQKAERLLFMPDLFNYFLSGQRVGEYTIASTSQMLNARKKTWDNYLIEKLKLPQKIMPPLVEPGAVIGNLTSDICRETGINAVNVIAVGSHDTASAVAAVPIAGENRAYLSSGTWSLLGIETKEPIINEKSYQYGFTNEGGVNRDYRFLKNTSGMWLLQQCRKKWLEQGNSYDYAQLVRLAEEARPFWAVIDPDDPSFLNPEDMPKAIEVFCKNSGQHVPQDHGQFVRVILESLALKYRYIIEKISEITGQRIQALHIVGGGSQNRLLNQFTANALGIPVIAGPVEATAIGNILVQMIAKGFLSNLEEGRTLVSTSFEQDEFLPQNSTPWDDMYQKALRIFSGE